MAATDPNQMGFFDHLDELRGRIFKSLIIWVIVFCVCFYYHQQIFDFLAKPFTDLDPLNSFIMVDPKEPFISHIRACFYVSAVLSSGLVFYHVWAFVAPGLTKGEKFFAIPFLIFMTLFFVVGCLFSFLYVFPTALEYLITYAYYQGETGAQVTRNNYLSILFAFVLGMGASFELPLVIFFLAKIGLVSPKFLMQKFQYAVLIVFTISAIITPTPDPYIQTFLAVPMLLLYLLGVGAAALVYRKKKDEDASPALEDGLDGEGEGA